MNYRGKPFKRILFHLALLIFTLSFAANVLASGGHEDIKPEQKAGHYNVTLETQPKNILASEKATITIIVKNEADGQPVIGANITNKATMKISSSTNSTMSGMENADGMDKPIEMAMHEESNMNMEPGTYMAEVNFKQSGDWNQEISISSSLGKSTVNFPVSVGKSGPNWALIGTVAGLVVIAGIIAAIIKKRKYAETGGTL